MSTAPYLPDAEAVLAESHGHIVRARATHSTFATELQLVDELSAVRLGYDEQRAPRVTATLVCVLPSTVAELDRLDPRAGVRVELDLGYDRPGGLEDVATVADLGLRRVNVDYAARRMTLTLAGDEALLNDASAAIKASATGATHAAAIEQLLAQAINPAPELVATVTGDAVTVDPVPDRQAAAQDLADRLEAQLYDDGTRTWQLRPVPTLAAVPDVTLTVGEGGTVLEPVADLARDSWFNYVAIRYRWRNSSGADQQTVATAYLGSGPWGITGDAGKRILLDERNVPAAQFSANAAARSVLARQASRSRSFSFRAIAAYWLRPGSTVSVTLPGGAPELHLVTAVEFQPLAGTMTVDTRLPDPTLAQVMATTTPPPAVVTDPPPPPVADPTPPAKLRYVSEWLATDSQAFKSTGDRNTALTDTIAQGYYGKTNGNQQSVILFGSGGSLLVPGVRGEQGKTLPGAILGGGATVQRVQVELVPTHWWSSEGGSLRVGWSKVTSMPSSFKGATVRAVATSGRAEQPRWVDLTSTELAAFVAALKTGEQLAVTIGPGVGTTPTHYGLVAGHNYPYQPWRPRVRVTYTK